MSSSEYSKCVTVNESNIPIPKRSYTGAKKSKGCAQLPELQKYIETIIKASNECDSEDTSMLDKDKKSKERKSVGRQIPRKNDSKMKQNQIKFDSNRCKTKIQPKAPVGCEAVSSGETFNKFVSEFDDPRNWKIDRTQSLGPSLRIEHFLKKLYPNPYDLTSVKEFKNSKTELIFEKIEKDDVKVVALPDVVIPKRNRKFRLQTEVDLEMPDNVLDADAQVDNEKTNRVIENAEIKIKANERDNCKKDTTPAVTLENFDQSMPQKDQAKDVKDSQVTNSLSKPTQESCKSKNMNSVSYSSSRGSSLESLGDVLSKESRMNLKKRKSLKVKNNMSSAGSMNKICESKLQEIDLEGFQQNESDYDIGKLKLLSMSDSDDSASKEFQKSAKDIKDKSAVDYAPIMNSEICEDFTKVNEFNDLFQIYNVMNKATESFLLISSKNECMNTEIDMLQNLEEKKFAEMFNNLSNQAKLCQSNKEETDFPDIKEELKSSGTIKSKSEDKFASVEKDENNLLNTESKEELRFRKKLEEKSSDDAKQKDCSETEEELGNLGKSNALGDFGIKANKGLKREDLDTSQKIDEVLEFMYDCLIKFNKQEKFLHEREKQYRQETKKELKKSSKKLPNEALEDPKKEKPSTSQLYKEKSYHPSIIEKDSCESLSEKSLLDVKEIRTKYTAALNELNRKQNFRVQSKRYSGNSSSDLVISDKRIKNSVSRQRTSAIENETHSAYDLNIQSLLLPELSEIQNESCIQTVESQNELGGLAEEALTITPNSKNNLRISKPILPLSVKVKRSKTNIYKTLKDVLETEEKLLAGELTAESKEKSGAICPKSSHIFIRDEIIGAYSLENEFEHSNSNFVICVNSFPRSLRTVTVRQTVSQPPPLTISVSDLKSWDLKPLTYYPKHHLKKLSIPSETSHCALRLFYKVKEGAIMTMNKTVEAYTAMPVCVKTVVILPKPQEESHLKSSECYLRVKPIKKSLFVETNIPDTNKYYLQSALTLTSSISHLISMSGSGFDMKTDDEKPVEALLEALKEAEEKVYQLEKTTPSAENLFRSSDSLFSYSESEILRAGNSENEEKEYDRTKIHELLLRTYNLQQKLHRYLHKISYMQRKALSCPLIQKDSFLDLGVFIRDKTESNLSLTELEINQEHHFPLLQWYLQPPIFDQSSKADEAIAVSVQMVDCGTSYNPPSDEENKTSDGQSHNAKNSSLSEKEENCQDDEDDSSSIYSFKSSNDFSESNEIQNTGKEITDHSSHGELIEKLYNKIESFRQSFEEEKLKNQQKKDSNTSREENFNQKEFEELKENKLVEYDPITTAKVLKTVFKGRRSSTELTIGLKDVPMTKVSNISVEKTKFSANHTKISICISKEKPEEFRPPNKINKELLHNSYYFDRLRPSLSSCRTECSRLNDDISKSSQSLNELNKKSDEDEDDYKSVGSTIADSEADGICEEKLKPKEKTTVELPPPKSFTKHRFDFYRKMDLNKEENKTRQTTLTNTWPRYKELEPLKQALTEMQIRMRSIKRDAILNSNDYYERALKLAKMSAGFCQSCGTRAVIPEDTFGFYKTLLPRRCTHRNRHIRTALTPNSSFYSFRSSKAEMNDQYCDLNIKHSSSYLLNRTTHLRSSLHDMPILFERI